MNKVVALLVAFLAATNAFAPMQQPSTAASSTELNALFDNIANMDLFDRKKSLYGARSGKNLKVGEIKGGYVPDGLTEAQYNAIRKDAAAKKEANYQRNVKKAGIFEDFTQFYLKRGTEENAAVYKTVTKGHKMVKTKYDWSKSDDNKGFFN